jgi:hypothetical protein
MKTTRMGPWDLDSDLWDKLNMIKIREQRPWRWMLTKGVELFIEWYEAKHGVVRLPGADVLPVVASLAAVVPAAVVPAAVVPAAVVPAQNVVELPSVVPTVSLPQTEAEKRVERLRGQIELHKERIEGAKVTLAREPGSLQGAAQLRSSILIVERREADLVAALEALRVEQEALSSNPIDNGEKEEACGAVEVEED